MEETDSKNIVPVEIEDQMRKSYLAYAMSVIVGRALPDVRDGLKPVHRRILYAMNERGWRHDKSFVKSAKIVGEVIGNFHPHGDVAVYETMVRMAQDFAMRAVLIDGQGNFGSVDGDPPAAYRYTEARLTETSEQLLKDLDKSTVDFVPNFDGSRKEPVVLPAAWPNLLVNGSSGIAVGMATKIPPHNLRETIEALELLIQNPNFGITELMKKVPAPDFPTGGTIIGKEALKKAYETGKGSIIIRSVVDIEETARSRKAIIVKEIPYEVKKNDLISKIAELVNDRKIEGISEIRDESDRKGMRILISLKKDFNPQIILNQLYKKTSMQISYGINFLALVGREPRLLNLKEILTHYLSHRKEIIIRRTQYEQEQAEKKEHILKGLKIALDFIDAVISLIRRSETVEIARGGLMKKFDLTEIQANAILEMRLQKLTSLESKKIVEELKYLEKKIKELKALLKSETKLMEVVSDELIELKNKYSSPRKSEISAESTGSLSFESEDLIANENEVVTLTEGGYIKRVPADTFKRQQRGGKGVISGGKKEDILRHIHLCQSHDLLFFFSNRGKVFYLKTFEIPEGGKDSRGKNIRTFLSLIDDERITAIVSIKKFSEEQYLMLLTKKGIIKKIELRHIQNAKKGGVLVVQFKSNEDDHLVGVVIVENKDHIFLATKGGLGLRTEVEKVRAQGRVASGVSGMSLKGANEMVGISKIKNDSDRLFMITEKGYGKRVSFSEFLSKGRGGKGMIFCKCTEKIGRIASIKSLEQQCDIIVTTTSGMTLRISANGVPAQSRGAAGVRVLNINENDRVVDTAVFNLVD